MNESDLVQVGGGVSTVTVLALYLRSLIGGVREKIEYLTQRVHELDARVAGLTVEHHVRRGETDARLAALERTQ